MAEKNNWKNGDVITAEKLNRMEELASEAHDASLDAQIAGLKLLCDETGRIWGAAATSVNGVTATFPAVMVTTAPVSMTPMALAPAE